MNDPQQHVAAVAMLEMLQQNRLDSFLRKHDYFDGKEATRYLRNFNQEMKRSKLEDAEKIDMFISVVAASVEGRIKLIKTDKSWDEYQTAVKKTFRLHDSEKATAYTFMNWVNRSSKTEPIDEVFATFELKYTDLPPDERVELKDKCLLFVQAVSKHDRTHLIHKLMEGNERLTKSWEKVQQEVERCVAFQEISEHLDSDSADHQVPERKSPSQRNEPSNDIGSITQMMKDLQLQMLHLTKSQNTMIAKPQANVQTPRCVWCDSPAHRRRDCEACTQAIADRLVRVVDGKLHRVSDDKLLPAKFGRGGIQSYFEGAAAAVQLTNNNDEAEVYQCQLEPMNPLSSMNPPSVQPSIIPRRRVGNEYLNGYSPLIASMFKINHDIRFLIGGAGPDVTYYIMKYVTKDQKQFENTVAMHLAAFDKRLRREETLPEDVTDQAIGRGRILSMLSKNVSFQQKIQPDDAENCQQEA